MPIKAAGTAVNLVPDTQTEVSVQVQQVPEAANGSVLQVICSAAAKKLNMFKEHLLGGFLLISMALLKLFL